MRGLWYELITLRLKYFISFRWRASSDAFHTPWSLPAELVTLETSRDICAVLPTSAVLFFLSAGDARCDRERIVLWRNYPSRLEPLRLSVHSISAIVLMVVLAHPISLSKAFLTGVQYALQSSLLSYRDAVTHSPLHLGAERESSFFDAFYSSSF